jgi:nuclear receptor subfamily 1 group D protein 3
LTGQQELLQDFSKRFSPAIRGVVEFAKRIPGFAMLPQDDQVTLLKAGVFEVLLVRLACMFDAQVSLCHVRDETSANSAWGEPGLDNTMRSFFLSDEQHDLPERTGAEERGHPQQLEREIPYGFHV